MFPCEFWGSGWNEFQSGSQRFCPELRCRPLMTMALDVVASLGLATDDAKAMNFAGLCCLVRGSVIAGAPRTIRKAYQEFWTSWEVVFREVLKTALHPRRCSSGSKMLMFFG
jgi:hypothetical protein